MKSILKNLLLLVGLGVIVWLGYTFYTEDSDPLAARGILEGQAALEGQLFLTQLTELRSIEFDTSLFTDPRFRSLVDERPSLSDEPFGRPNPFAPIN